MNIQYVKEHFPSWPQLIRDKAIAIYIYGSVARSDNDADSDCDILVCIDNCLDEEYCKLKSSVHYLQKDHKYEFAFYQISALEVMCRKGSYFLWHIKSEGVLLYQRNDSVQLLLDNLPPYHGTLADLCEYSEILDDIKLSIEEDQTAFKYDLSVLATLARNICIASCYLIGQMDFGRITPVSKCMQFWKDDFPFSLSEYTELYVYRFANARSRPQSTCLPSKNYMLSWYKRIDVLLNLALSLCRS